MNDGEEIVVPMIHTVPKKRKDGSPWRKDVLCARTSYDDDTYCELCASDDEEIKGPWPRLVTYVYVTTIAHPKRDPGKDWEQRVANGRTVYVETVNAPRLLIAKNKLSQQIDEYYMGDPEDESMVNRPPTLLDRPYRLSKIGEGTTAYEELRSLPAAEMPAEVREAIAQMKPLAETVEAEFSDGQPARQQRPAASGGGYDPSRIPSASDFAEGDDDLEDLDF